MVAETVGGNAARLPGNERQRQTQMGRSTHRRPTSPLLKETDGNVRLYDMRTVPNLETMRANGSLEDLDFSSDGKLVAAVVVVVVVRLWVAGALLVRLRAYPGRSGRDPLFGLEELGS